MTGSIAYVGSCRANFLSVRDREDPTGRRVPMLDNGCNLSDSVPNLAYRIEDRGDGPALTWEPEPVDVIVEQALAAEPEDRREGAILERAGIPYRDAGGLVFDFHSLRCQTATLLDAAGVSPRVAQRLMRHSTPGLTDRYTKPRAVDVERAALSLPLCVPIPTSPRPPVWPRRERTCNP